MADFILKEDDGEGTLSCGELCRNLSVASKVYGLECEYTLYSLSNKLPPDASDSGDEEGIRVNQEAKKS